MLNASKHIFEIDRKSNIRYWMIAILLVLLAILFLPWTQHIRSEGAVTSLLQEQRPQDVNAIIAGSIKKWFVKEGDWVKKGDTILQLGEVKAEYLDPKLIERNKQQVDAKIGAAKAYEDKVQATDRQIVALKEALRLKIALLVNKNAQLKNKLEAERVELSAAENEFNLAKDQYDRLERLFKQGLAPQTQLQQRDVAYKNASAKKIAVTNKLRITEQEIANNNLEQSGAEQEYDEKINKALAEKYQALSAMASTEAEISKLENTGSNYEVRNGMYFITATQDGQVVQAKKGGIGEMLKDGECVARIVPSALTPAVEMYVKPVDLPLVQVGQRVSVWFDGFPTIVFSGWPQASYGIYFGVVSSVESSISENGKYRVLVRQDVSSRAWPNQLNIGVGANCITLLKDVPIWYVLWRSVNGFPPDFYGSSKKDKNEKAKK
jgi:multidrug efflux pump subunit AcrA (membrane-fusion protein)